MAWEPGHTETMGGLETAINVAMAKKSANPLATPPTPTGERRMSEYSELVKRLKDRAGLLRQMDEVTKPRQVTTATQNALREAVQAIERLSLDTTAEGTLDMLLGVPETSPTDPHERRSERAQRAVQQLANARAEIERLKGEVTDEVIEVGKTAIDDYFDGTKDAPFEGSVKACFDAMREALAAPAPGKDSEGKE